MGCGEMPCCGGGAEVRHAGLSPHTCDFMPDKSHGSLPLNRDAQLVGSHPLQTAADASNPLCPPQYGNGKTPSGEDIPGGLRPDASCTIAIGQGQRSCTLLFTPSERTQWSISSRDIWTQVGSALEAVV